MSTARRAELVERVMKEFRKTLAGTILFNEKVAAEVGLNGTDLQCLHLLELQGAATPGDLARWSGLTTGGVTVAVDRLEKAGYVKRQPNPEDRRSTIIQPVAARMRRLQAIYKSKGELTAGVLAEYDDRALQVLLSFFRTLNSGDGAIAGAAEGTKRSRSCVS
jgi:MarR family transcriptional regulator, organic hydroperoxide resistance regulator